MSGLPDGINPGAATGNDGCMDKPRQAACQSFITTHFISVFQSTLAPVVRMPMR